MRVFRLLSSGFLGVIGLGLLFLIERTNQPDFLQNVATEIYGAIIVALFMWAVFWPTKRLEWAKEIHRNHTDLVVIARSPKQLSWYVIEVFVDRAHRVFREAPDSYHKLFQAYLDSLEDFRNLYDQDDPTNDPKNNAANFRDTFNGTFQPFQLLVKKLNMGMGRRIKSDSNSHKILSNRQNGEN